MSSDLVVQMGLCQLHLLKGDITGIAADAIVNAANSALAGGGGVDGAIHRVGGPEIMRELDEIRGRIGQCPTGQAVMSGAGKLPARFVIHAVGPVYKDGKHGEPELLASCYEVSLNLAASHDAQTVSFPSISTGVYGYPVEEAASIAVRTVGNWLREHAEPIRVVKLVQFSEADHQVYRRSAQKLHDARAAGR